MADDDPWTQRFNQVDKLHAQTAAPATTVAASTPAVTSNAPPASATGTLDPISASVHRWLGLPTPAAAPMPEPGSDAAAQRSTANAAVAGMYGQLGDIVRNVTGGSVTPPALPADVQADVKAHPYAAGAGNVIAGTAAAIPVAAAMPEIGAGWLASAATGAGTGAVTNLLTGSPDESWYRRAGTGAVLGAGLGLAGNRIGSWFGAGQALDPDVAKAAQTAKAAGVTDIGPANLPGGNIKAMGVTPTYAQSGQIDNAVSKILGDDVPNWNTANFGAVQGRIGSAISNAANSGSIDVNAPLSPGGPTVNDMLANIRTAASAAPDVGAKINPLIARIQARIDSGGVISGKDFDNLVGNGSVLHDLVGDDNPYIKEAAQALDSTMDAGFRNTSGVGAYNDWVDARTKYRMLMGVKQAILPNGHINPTTLFNGVQNRFTDLKGTPVSTDPLVGSMGDFASSIRTLFGGGAAPPQSAPPGLWRSLATGMGIGSAPELANALMSGNYASPETYLSPAGLAGAATGAAALGGRALGQIYQRTPRFVNQLINNTVPASNWLVAPGAAVGTEVMPQRQVQP
jgi:hypothetical protein